MHNEILPTPPATETLLESDQHPITPVKSVPQFLTLNKVGLYQGLRGSLRSHLYQLQPFLPPGHTFTPLLYQQLPCCSQSLYSCSRLSPKSAATGPFLPRFSLGPYSMPPDPKAVWSHLQKIPYAYMNAGTCCRLRLCSPCPWATFSRQMSLAEFIPVSLLVE